jgi:hypothetical protein
MQMQMQMQMQMHHTYTHTLARAGGGDLLTLNSRPTKTHHLIFFFQNFLCSCMALYILGKVTPTFNLRSLQPCNCQLATMYLYKTRRAVGRNEDVTGMEDKERHY